MIVWRISNHQALDGTGGLLASARWHTKGHPVIYAAEHPGTAQLEWLANLEVQPSELPSEIPFMKIEVPDDVAVAEIVAGDLPTDWREKRQITQTIGDDWLAGGTSLVVFVPSAVVPARNVLINPGHGDFERITNVQSLVFPFDYRLR